jgi:Xaa-Pro aminopeptidase
MNINQRLEALRQQMTIHGIDAYIIPSSDPHQSEYVAQHWQNRQWIAPFTGSMGYVVVTQTHAGVWTDSRYFIQCEQELAGTPFELKKQIVQGAPEHITWLTEALPKGSRIGCNGAMFSVDQIRSMQKAFGKSQIDLITDSDLISPIWKDRPSLLNNEIFEHDVQFTGRTRKQKLSDIRAKMKEKKADFHLVSTLDDIGWTLNLRGSDVDCNPVFIAYLVIEKQKSYLFIEPSQVPEALKNKLNEENIFIKSYHTISDFLSQLTEKQSIAVDTSNLNFELYSTIKKANIVKSDTFSILMKAMKNKTEMKFIREVMVKDGVALVKAFRWLEKTLDEREVSEYEVASILAQFRSDMPHYFGESFTAIVGYQSNGALNHYHPTPDSSSMIKKEGILLIDSGGQYQDGTTDITRTIALSTPNAEQKRNYTLVLKGHISIATLKFPAGTKGVQMDILARMHLWQYGLNYGHGTGHGVGFFMNVHEPPQGIVPGLNSRGTTPHVVGMFTSNEPGFYKDGEYGIRIENLVLCVEAEKTDFAQFLKFETVTLFPIDTSLIDVSLLTRAEKTWFNAYHKRVNQKLSVHLDTEEKAWLAEKCKKI